MMWFVLGPFGCIPDVGTVVLSGTVHDEPNAGGSVVNGADVYSFDESGESIDSVATDADGAFSIEVPAGRLFFVQVQGPEAIYVPTAFSGEGGLQDSEAGTGYPWVAGEDYIAELAADWEGCPGLETLGQSNVAIVGDVRMWMNISDPDQMAKQANVVVRATPEVGEEVEACYHDADGVYDSGALGTGADGLFLVAGVDAGGIAVTIEYTDVYDVERYIIYQYLAPDASLVPILPTFVYSD